MRCLFLVLFVFKISGIVSQDTLTYATLSKAQYSSWKNIEQKWLSEKYYPFLKKEKIKLSCAGCESVYVWLVFKKDNSNTTYDIIKSKKCGGDFTGRLLSELKKLLNEIILPVEFNNTVFRTSIGSALKC
jgi:hypothetical protein